MPAAQIRPKKIQALVTQLFAETPADAELLGRFVEQSDSEAFTVLVHRHGPMVLNLCRRITGNAHAAEDAFQATFLLLARRAREIQKPEALAGWLYGAARRIALRACRLPPPLPPGPTARRSLDPLDEISARELLTIVEEEVARLPESYREALILCSIEGLSITEAAHRLGTTPGAIRGRLERGRTKLAGRLGRRGLTLPAALTALVALPRVALAAPLIEATVKLVSNGAAISSTFALLVKSATVAGTKARLFAGTALLLLTATGITFLPGGPTSGTFQSARAENAPAAATPADPLPKPREIVDVFGKRADALGEPLPERALLRLGNERFTPPGIHPCYMAHSPDGKWLVVSDMGGPAADAQVAVFDAATGKEAQRLANASFARFSPNGKLVVVSSTVDPSRFANVPRDRQLKFVSRLYDTSIVPWKQIRDFPSESVDETAFSPDSTKIALTLRSGLGVRIRSLIDKKLVDLVRPPATIRALCWSKDGDRLLTVDRDRRVVIWNAKTGAEIESMVVDLPEGMELYDWECGIDSPFLTHGAAPIFSTDGATVALAAYRLNDRKSFPLAGVDENAVVVLDMASRKQRTIRLPKRAPALPEHLEMMILSMTFAPDGKALFLAEREGRIVHVDLKTDKADVFADVGAFLVLSMSVTPDGKWLAVNSQMRKVRFFDVVTGKEKLDPADHTGELRTVAVSPDGRTIATAGYDRTIKFWDRRTGEHRRTLLVNSGVYHLVYSPDGRLLASISGIMPFPHSNENSICLWDVATGELLDGWKKDLPKSHCAVQIAFSGDAKVLAELRESSADTAEIITWDVASGKEAARRQLDLGRRLRDGYIDHYQNIAAFSPDLKTLYLAGHNAGEYDVATGKRKGAFTGLPENRQQLAATPDFRQMVFHDERDSIFFYSLPDRNLLWTNNLHVRNGWCGAPRFSLDGRYLASLAHEPKGEKRTIVLREVASAEKVLEWPAPTGPNPFAFTPDGMSIVSTNTNAAALVWSLAPDQWRNEPPALPLSPAKLDRAWDRLASDNASDAYEAIWTLTLDPERSIPYLKERLRPAEPFPNDKLRKLIDDLNDNNFRVRDQATQELKRLGDQIEKPLRQVLATRPSVETERRLNQVLADLEFPLRSRVALRGIRALTVLERVGTPEARQLLDAISKGIEGPRLTSEAKAAVSRMK